MLNNLLYIDPAATTALISSLTAICVACGAAFIIIWRKIKKGARKVLHIDPNAGKEVEADLIIDGEVATADATEPATQTEAEETTAQSETEELTESDETEETATQSETEEPIENNEAEEPDAETEEI